MSRVGIEDSNTQHQNKRNSKSSWYRLVGGVGVLASAAFLYLDRYNGISAFIHSFGISGSIGAVLMMAVVCMTPFPSEGLLIMYLKVYGLLVGTLYAWIGFILGTIGGFGVARYLGNTMIHSWISPERFEAIDEWIQRKGTMGLFIVRLLPIPAFVVNYVTGLIPSISLWKHTWTSAVAIIPYYVGIAFIFLGVSKQYFVPIFICVPMFILMWLAGWVRRERLMRSPEQR